MSPREARAVERHGVLIGDTAAKMMLEREREIARLRRVLTELRTDAEHTIKMSPFRWYVVNRVSRALDEYGVEDKPVTP